MSQEEGEVLPLGKERKEEKVESVLPLEGLAKALEEEKARAQSYLDGWRRAQADFINLKRRIEQEKDDIATLAQLSLVASIFPVLDDIDRAFASLPPGMLQFTWVDGVRLIQRKLLAILEVQGLSEIKATGENFDARFHEAVTFGDGEEGKVLEELQKGYKFRDRVIRPALVKVGRNPSLEGPPPQEGEKKE